MAGVQFVELDGKRVLLISMANCGEKESLAIMDEAMKVIEQQEPKSVITITQVEGMHYCPATVRGIWDFAQHNDPWVTVGVVVGLSGVRRNIFESVVKLTRRRLYGFESMSEARTWLSEELSRRRPAAVDGD